MSQQRGFVLDIHDKPKAVNWLTLSLQHLFAMFGSTVLVPFLVGFSPAIALISSGVGTLAFLLITRGQIPSYLGSSFAFITPIIFAKASFGPEETMVGCFLAGLVYGIVALIIKGTGINWIMKLLPPVVVGPVIMVIGLGLANTAVGMAMNDAKGNYSLTYLMVALVTLAITVACSIFFKNIISLIPVLMGIIGGYIFAYTQGLVDFSKVVKAGAAVFAILFGFVGKINALISSIPTPVMGGISILLFGIIASSGLRMMVDAKVDLGSKRNLMIASIILVLGIGGAHLDISEHVKIDSMALSAIMGVLLNLVLPKEKIKEAENVQQTSVRKIS